MMPSNIPPEQQVKIDFDSEEYSSEVKALKPAVFIEGKSYCCLYGPDLAAGIMGCGDTPEEALHDWEANLHERIKNAKQDPQNGDEVVFNAIDTLKIIRGLDDV